ncbi:sperm flagellar protein 1 isoform X2 [Lasioglossum baleicum]|uniref:sperm flagellar protein 1 isoform X2 n=1 Tax=Lasioglossum baleicum TaxID=434251 RepID=UPI003FCE0668
MTANEYEKIPEDQLDQIHTWIATIPFSKPSKNLTRDFSDAVLMAELLKVYYPRYVDLHNYVPANNFTTKKENWNILNRKVLSKIDMKQSKDTINQLANFHPGTVEHLLLELWNKLLKDPEHQHSLYNIKEKDSESKIDEASIQKESSIHYSPNQLTPNTIVSGTSMLKRVKTTLLFTFHWVLLWLCFWQYFPTISLRNRQAAPATRTQDTSQNTNSGDVVPRQVCVQLRQELREKGDIISTLNCKVAYLENAMRVKDLRISNLASQILQNAVESEQLARNQTNATPAKLRPRPSIIREKIKVED